MHKKLIIIALKAKTLNEIVLKQKKSLQLHLIVKRNLCFDL